MTQREANSSSDAAVADLRYGFWSWKPRCLQVFNTAAWVVVFMSLGNCFQSLSINGLLGVVLSTIEKRFDLASAQSSWIASAYEVGTIPALLVLGFMGTRVHRPVVVSMGFLTVAVGCILFFLPHFVTPVYKPDGGVVGDNVCQNDTVMSPCEDDDKVSATSLSRYLPLFVVARLFHGLGATPVYILGVTYMDDSATKEKFSLYIGIFYALGVIGPAIGTIGGGFLLNLFTDFPSLSQDEIGIDRNDPRWIGAWWLPFCIALALNFIIALPIAGFPRDLPGADEIRKTKTSEAYSKGDQSQSNEGEESVDYARNCSELGDHLKILLTNPTYLLLTLFIACDSLIVAGFTAFGPKYLENQFSLPSSLAGALFGAILLPAGAGGTILGGAIISRMKLTCSQIMKGETVLTILTIASGFIFFLTCDNLRFAGVTVPYGNVTNGVLGSLNDSCNADCFCADQPYEPICSHDNVRFYSPCYAGCQTTVEDDLTYFYNCSCVSPVMEAGVAPASSAECTASSCATAPLFLTIFFFAVVMLFTCSSMNITATVRSIPASQRTMAIGIQWIVLRLLGTVPGPIAFGAAFDSACLLWEENCGKRGTCLYYANADTSRYLFAVCFSVKVASLIFMVGAYFFYRPPPEDSSVLKVPPTSTTEVETTGGDIDKQLDITSNGSNGIISGKGFDNQGYQGDCPTTDSEPTFTQF